MRRPIYNLRVGDLGIKAKVRPSPRLQGKNSCVSRSLWSQQPGKAPGKRLAQRLLFCAQGPPGACLPNPLPHNQSALACKISNQSRGLCPPTGPELGPRWPDGDRQSGLPWFLLSFSRPSAAASEVHTDQSLTPLPYFFTKTSHTRPEYHY